MQQQMLSRAEKLNIFCAVLQGVTTRLTPLEKDGSRKRAAPGEEGTDIQEIMTLAFFASKAAFRAAQDLVLTDETEDDDLDDDELDDDELEDDDDLDDDELDDDELEDDEG